MIRPTCENACGMFPRKRRATGSYSSESRPTSLRTSSTPSCSPNRENLGVDVVSLGELLSQGKNNLDAWWISLATFTVLVATLVLSAYLITDIKRRIADMWS